MITQEQLTHALPQATKQYTNRDLEMLITAYTEVIRNTPFEAIRKDWTQGLARLTAEYVERKQTGQNV